MKEFYEENIKEGDCIIGPVEHTIFLNVYHPDIQYFLNGYKRYSLPFVNTDALTSREQLSQREGNVWYMCFQGSEPEPLAEWYDYEEAISFHYMYYDFVIWKLTLK